jgi:hypothetical protein
VVANSGLDARVRSPALDHPVGIACGWPVLRPVVAPVARFIDLFCALADQRVA